MKGDKDQSVMEEKGGTGFPYLIFLDAEGNVLSKVGYPRPLEALQTAGQKAKEYVDLRAKAEKGDNQAQYDLLLLRIEMGNVKASEVRKKLAELKDLTDEQKKKVEDQLVDLDVKEIARTITRDAKTRAEAGKKFVEIQKAGRAPKGDREFQTFYGCIMDYCEDQKDAAGFEKAFQALKDKYGSNMRKEFLEKNEARLKKLKGEK